MEPTPLLPGLRKGLEVPLDLLVAAGGPEQRGSTPQPQAGVDTDVETFVAVMTKRQTLKSAQRTSRLTLTGNGDAFGRLLNVLPRPELAPIPFS